MRDLNNLIPADSGWILGIARAINDLGQIVGVGYLEGEEGNRAFLLTPIPPEPVSIDIIPKTCPNKCPIKSGGSVEVAIRGTVDFDVNDIDIASVRLEGVAPTRSSLKDKSSPVVAIVDDKYPCFMRLRLDYKRKVDSRNFSKIFAFGLHGDLALNMERDGASIMQHKKSKKIASIRDFLLNKF